MGAKKAKGSLLLADIDAGRRDDAEHEELLSYTRARVGYTAHATVRRNEHASETEPVDGRAAKPATPE
jgi:hypothetical protein